MNIPDEYEDGIKKIALFREEIKTKIDNLFSPFVSHIESLSLDIDEDVILEWYQSKYHELEDRLDATNELAQLGISVEIIDHELYSLYAQMANSLKFSKTIREYILKFHRNINNSPWLLSIWKPIIKCFSHYIAQRGDNELRLQERIFLSLCALSLVKRLKIWR